MEANDTIDLYDAIRQMRELSQKGHTFSFAHATYNRDTCESAGVRYVKSASIRPAAKGDDVTNADFKIFYMDHDLKMPRICWQCLIMFFEGKKVMIN